MQGIKTAFGMFVDPDQTEILCRYIKTCINQPQKLAEELAEAMDYEEILPDFIVLGGVNSGTPVFEFLRLGKDYFAKGQKIHPEMEVFEEQVKESLKEQNPECEVQ